MLNAILYGKKRGSGQEGRSLIEDYEGAEDLLTASVFERLSYLPDEKLWSILSSPEIWKSHTIPLSPGSLCSSRFLWPKWKLRDGLTTVEPDCFLEFENIALIIEAKRYDNRMQQYAEQLARELIGYWEKPNSKPVMLLAIGGFVYFTDKEITKLRGDLDPILQSHLTTIPSFSFTAISWASLFKVIEKQLFLNHEKRIVDDIREAMILHGIPLRDPVWLEDIRKMQLDIAIAGLRETSMQTFAFQIVMEISSEDWWCMAKDLSISEASDRIFKGDLK